MTKSVVKSEFAEDPQGKLDTRRYRDIVSIGLLGKFVGGAVILQDDHGRRLAFCRRNWAVSDVDLDHRDEERVFDLNTVAAWGSTSKVITTAAVLAALQQHAGSIHHVSPSQMLRQSMRSLLPRRWAEELHPSFEEVTIRHLLQHRAGFRHSGEGQHIRERLRAGVETADGVGKRSYSNTSMGIFHFLLARLVDPGGMQEAEARLKNASDEEYDRLMQDVTADCYNSWTQRKVFAPAGVTAGTNPAQFQANFALAYPSRHGTDQVRGKHMPDGTRHAASGGWLMSIKGMMQFLHTVKYTDLIIDRRSYDLMENKGSPDDALGWWTSGRASGGLSFTHAGKRNAGNGSHCAQVINYPNGYQAAMIVNSTPPEGVDLLDDILVPAYNEALTS